MVVNLQDTEHLAIPLPIASETRTIAHEFATQQATKKKSEQVLYNTLAVLTVKSYLKMLGIATDLASSDSWNPIMRACDNVADLNISNLGKLECRPLKSTDTSFHVPMEVWDLRLGYVVVKIDDSLKKALLLGFVLQANTEEISVAALQPIETLIDRLHDIKYSTANASVVNLGEWLNDFFTEGWSTVETLLNPEKLSPILEFRDAKFSREMSLESGKIKHSTQRAKLLDLGIQLGNRQVVLLVEVTSENSDSIGVTLRVHPSSNDIYLPEALILKVIESSGEFFMQAQSRSQDNFIQLQFSGKPKEQFSVQIVLGELELSEKFQL